MRALTELSALPGRVASGVSEWFLSPADPRAYGLLRIGYAVSALAVLSDVFGDRYTLLASTGLFGGALPFGPLLPFNVFRFARSEAAVTAALLVFGASMVCLALGVLPRAAAVVTYVWTTSYVATAPVSQSGFDTILRVVGFVLVITPSYGSFRLGSERAPAEAPPAYGLRFVQWQLLLIYLGTLWLKAPDPFWRNGEAIHYFLMSMFARFPNPQVSEAGPILAVVDYATLLIEGTVPFLLWMRRTRFLGVFLGFCLHAGIAATSKIALFSLTMLSLYPAFLEAEDFARLRRWFSNSGSGGRHESA